MASASEIFGAIQRKMHGKGVVRSGKGITLVIFNKNVDNIIRIIKSPENLDELIDGVSEAVKTEIKRQEGRFLGILLGTSSTSILKNMLTGKVVIRIGNSVTRAGKRCNDMDHMNKFF